MAQSTQNKLKESLEPICKKYLPIITKHQEIIQTQIEKLTLDKKQLALLQSVTEGLYEEIDKLSKKAPADFLTDLALSQVNDVIRETKMLINKDSYIQRLNEFVAAGDNPEHRDAVIVLRQIRQGLNRFSESFLPLTKLAKYRLIETDAILTALDYFLKQKEEMSKHELHERGFDTDNISDWFVSNYYSTTVFYYRRLEKFDLEKYFTIEI